MNLYDELCQSELDKRTLTYFGMPITYSSLFKKIEEAESAFRAIGVTEQSIVTMALPSTPESFACFYALDKIGATSSFVDVRYKASKIDAIMQKTNSRILLAMSFMLKELAKDRSLLRQCDYIIIIRGNESLIKPIRFLYHVADFFNGRMFIEKFHSNIFSYSRFITFKNSNNEVPQSAPEYANRIIFHTSGTTGQPKSVVMTIENLKKAIKAADQIMGYMKPSDIVLSIMPIFSFYGFVTQIHLPLTLGCNMIIVPYVKPGDIYRYVHLYRPNLIYGVASHWEDFECHQLGEEESKALRKISFTGDRSNPDFIHSLTEWLHKCGGDTEVVSVYGMTEVGPISYMDLHIDSPFSNEKGFAGFALDSIEVKIVDDEICVHSPCAMLEYYNDEHATNHLIHLHADKKHWIHTGDIGKINEDGSITVLGRKKRMVVYRDGSKIFLSEIEDALLLHPEVLECAVIATIVDKERRKEELVAFVVMRSHSKSVKGIHRWLKQQLPEHQIPRKIYPLDKLPHSITGKVNYEALSLIAFSQEGY